MAIVLEANYAKKLGLPAYSSHQYSISIRTELTDLNNVAEESRKLYRLLQDAVDDWAGRETASEGQKSRFWNGQCIDLYL